VNLKNDVASKSVFLSYASQDVDAARRICAAATPSQRDPDRRT
jgi:hypothetical protein